MDNIALRFKELDDGITFVNRQGNYVFKMFGKYYISNYKRKKMYDMDDYYWVGIHISWYWKLMKILFNEVKHVY